MSTRGKTALTGALTGCCVGLVALAACNKRTQSSVATMGGAMSAALPGAVAPAALIGAPAGPSGAAGCAAVDDNFKGRLEAKLPEKFPDYYPAKISPMDLEKPVFVGKNSIQVPLPLFEANVGQCGVIELKKMRLGSEAGNLTGARSPAYLQAINGEREKLRACIERSFVEPSVKNFLSSFNEADEGERETFLINEGSRNRLGVFRKQNMRDKADLDCLIPVVDHLAKLYDVVTYAKSGG